MNVFLTLGCWGREVEGFKLCQGVQNNILDLTKKSEKNIEIVKHLDSIYGILKKPIYNNVHTAIYSIQNKFNMKGDILFSEKKLKTIETFCTMHAKCGLYLRLIIKEEK